MERSGFVEADRDDTMGKAYRRLMGRVRPPEHGRKPTNEDYRGE